MKMRGAFLTLVAGLMLLCGTSCHNTTPTPPPPPLQPVAAPAKPSIASFTVQPSTVVRGQQATLQWSVTGATGVEIDNGIGQATLEDRRTVSPAQTTTYHLTATGAGGTAEASATVTVSTPPPAPTEEANSQARRARAEVLAERLQDIHFDYNTGDIRAADMPVIQADASVLEKLFELDPALVVVIEGHCDERGSAEYNIALGDRRANVVRLALVNLGVSAAKLNTISFGKERPVCVEENEDCYAKDRRAHLALGQ